MAIALLTVLGLLLRLHGVHQSFWYDEARTVKLLKLSPSTMFHTIPHEEATPPLYYAIAAAWGRLISFSTVSMRILSIIPGVATIPFTGLAAQRLLHSRRAGLIAAGLTACSPEMIWYSQEIRPYALMIAFGAASLLAFAYVRERPSKKAVAWWTLLSIGALATHYYALFLILPEAVLLAYWHRRDGTLWIGIAVLVICQAVLLPQLLTESSKLTYRYITKFPLNVRLGQVLPQFLIGQGAPDWSLFKFVAFALVLAALALLALRATAEERAHACLPIAFVGVSIVLALFAVAVGNDTFLTRNLLVAWVPAAIFLTACLSLDRGNRLGPMIAVALCAIGVFVAFAVVHSTELRRPGWQALADAIGTKPPTYAGKPQARLILIQRNPGGGPLEQYLPGSQKLTGKGLDNVVEVDIVAARSTHGWNQPTCWWGAGCNLVPSKLQPSYGFAHFHDAGRFSVGQFTVLRYRSDGGRPYPVGKQSFRMTLLATKLRHDGLVVDQ